MTRALPQNCPTTTAPRSSAFLPGFAPRMCAAWGPTVPDLPWPKGPEVSLTWMYWGYPQIVDT
ncbi:hypothetical protein, partial [Dermabacter sp. HMSC06F07]|uniref:hypothetical protein n=1 Tax=Dermabacter sp. HMSC06F07 TaxID=1581125 RepID=UPI001AF001AE